MPQREITRREALRIGGATMLAGAASGLAGCGIPGLGGGGGASYTQWLHEPGEFNDVDHYRISRLDASTWVDNEDQFSESTFNNTESFVESTTNIVGLNFDEIDAYLATNVGAVLTGSFNTGDVTDELNDKNYDEDTDHEGYTVFLSGDETRAVGVSGSAIVLAGRSGSGDPVGTPNQSDPVDTVETIIDVKKGNDNRYVDENDDFSKAVDELPTGARLTAGTQDEAGNTQIQAGVFENQVAAGSSLEVNGKTSDGTFVRVFEKEGDVDTGELEDWIDQDGSGEFFDDYDDLSVSTSGRAGVVTGTIDTDDI